MGFDWFYCKPVQHSKTRPIDRPFHQSVLVRFQNYAKNLTRRTEGLEAEREYMHQLHIRYVHTNKLLPLLSKMHRPVRPLKRTKHKHVQNPKFHVRNNFFNTNWLFLVPTTYLLYSLKNKSKFPIPSKKTRSFPTVVVQTSIANCNCQNSMRLQLCLSADADIISTKGIKWVKLVNLGHC